MCVSIVYMGEGEWWKALNTVWIVRVDSKGLHGRGMYVRVVWRGGDVGVLGLGWLGRGVGGGAALNNCICYRLKGESELLYFLAVGTR